MADTPQDIIRVVLVGENAAGQIAVRVSPPQADAEAALATARRMAGARPRAPFRRTEDGALAVDGGRGTASVHGPGISARPTGPGRPSATGAPVPPEEP